MKVIKMLCLNIRRNENFKWSLKVKSKLYFNVDNHKIYVQSKCCGFSPIKSKAELINYHRKVTPSTYEILRISFQRRLCEEEVADISQEVHLVTTNDLF